MFLDFTESKVDSNLYLKVESKIPMILLLYVDVMFLTGEYKLIKYARRIVSIEFKMKYLGMMHQFLGWRCGKMWMGFSLVKESMHWIF